MLISFKIKRNSAFSGSDKWRRLFFQLINVKMPTVVGILTFMSRKNFMLSRVEHEKVITSGPDQSLLSQNIINTNVDAVKSAKTALI